MIHLSINAHYLLWLIVGKTVKCYMLLENWLTKLSKIGLDYIVLLSQLCNWVTVYVSHMGERVDDTTLLQAFIQKAGLQLRLRKDQ